MNLSLQLHYDEFFGHTFNVNEFEQYYFGPGNILGKTFQVMFLCLFSLLDIEHEMEITCEYIIRWYL